jgi:Family of unknown function (DUF6131)
VIVLGIILVVLFGWLMPISILFDLGIVLVVIGAILAVVGTAGYAVGGRRHYY